MFRRLACIALGALLGSVASADAPKFNIFDLTEIAASSGVVQCEGTDVNEAGQIVGYEVLLSPEFTSRAIVWDTNMHVGFPGKLAGDNSTWTHDITEGGTVFGTSQLVTVKYQGQLIIVTEDNKATSWSGTQPTNLNTLVTGGDPLILQRAWAANESGVIVGTGNYAGQTARRGFRLENGIVTDLGAIPNGSVADTPVAVNSSGLIVGDASSWQSRAFSWKDGVLTNLHNHPSIKGVTSRAWGVNDKGQIVGEAQFLLSKPESPTLWENGVPVDLFGSIMGRPQGIAADINEQGDIVGYVADLDIITQLIHAFLIRDGVYYDLNTLIPPGKGWDNLIIAWAINNQGWIVGGAARNGQLGHGFLLVPVGKPGDFDLDGDVDQADLGALLASYGACAGQAGYSPRVDIDASLCVDQADLGELLANYGG